MEDIPPARSCSREIVSAYLGLLVGAELKRRKAMAVDAIGPDAAESDEEIAALVDVRASIGELDDIGRLARSATAQGASWRDVASSLGLTGDEAKSAYSSSQ